MRPIPCPRPPPCRILIPCLPFMSFLLSASAHPVETASTTVAATRHGECIADQSAGQPRPDNFIQVSSHEWYQPDALAHHHVVQGPGNSAADERADAQLSQPQDPVHRYPIQACFLRFADQLAVPCLDDTDDRCHVEDRCYPVVPRCECRFHLTRVQCTSGAMPWGRTATALTSCFAGC
jgi:hypothetical protein